MGAPGVLRTQWRTRSRDPWRDNRIIRADPFSAEMFAQHAVSLADSQMVVLDAKPVVSLLNRLEENSRSLVRSYEAIVAELERGNSITPAAEWLVDNFHTVEENTRQVRRDLPQGYFRQLPKLGPGFLEGHPRIFGIMWAYIAHTDSLFDPDQLGGYIRAYEARKALTLGELWAVAINLRILLIENVRRAAEQVVESIQDRHAADRVADRLLGADGSRPELLGEVVPDWETRLPRRPFAVQLIRRLTEQPAATALDWVEGTLLSLGLDPEEVVQEEHQAQAGATLTMRNIFRSLRLLSDVNWEDWLESVSLIEAELRTNPGYAALDFTTRNLYRTSVERLARGAHQHEIDVARAALALTRAAPDPLGQDLGFWFSDEGLPQFERSLGYRPTRHERVTRAMRGAGLAGYLGSVALVTLTLTGLGLWATAWVADGIPRGVLLALGVLALIPVSDFALNLVNTRVTRTLHAAVLPALALRDGVPEHLRTLVVVPTMITSPAGVDEAVAALERHHLANHNGELYFAAATDWADSPTEHRDDDGTLLDAACAGIRELNATYGDRFFLFHRHRVHNPAEGVWMGWERKRGKLEELNRLLRGATDTSYSTVEGRLPGPFRYVITLDSDTLLPRGAAKRLVGKLAHPLNEARIDADTRVRRGYTILQPRVTPSLPRTEDSSPFQNVYTTQQGLDPYAFAVSDVYQDLFGEGSFAGKGIYDIDALTRVLEGRIPENAVLSHDLLEGNYARSALVTDVEVVEEYPTSYEVDASRNHRWTRGDWQLLPWILHRHAGLSRLGLWKMTDNLRRSLSPVALVLSLLVALAVLPAPGAALWFALMISTFVLPPLLPLIPGLLLRREGETKRSQLRALADDVRQALALGALNLTFLSHKAAMMVDAIARTLWRLTVSRAHLLEWTTAAAARSQARGTVGRFAQVMAGGFVAPALALAIAVVSGLPHVAVAAVPAALWLLAPVIAHRVSRPYGRTEVDASADDLRYLRQVARRTWLFFETFVTAADHHLPPDNVQEDPATVVAHRTSPTNIGLYLLTTVAARDLGWIGLVEATDRLEATTRTLISLQHVRGHLLNWYDTTTLEPLNPRYVSSVDSGNLAGHLLAVANTCVEWSAEPRLDRDRWDGIADGVALVRLAASAGGGQPGARAGTLLAAVERSVNALTDTADADAGLAAVDGALLDLSLDTGLTPDVQQWVAATRRTVSSLRQDLALTADGLQSLRERLHWVEQEVRREFDETDFAFLLDERRGLLSVGYRVEEGQLDDSCYDLLASECRLGSYIAIAKGDIPTRHWFRLGRSVTDVGGGAALLSWSGSMFEYLMPALVMRTPAQGLLSRTSQLVVRRQRAYAAEHGIPWGISESGYNARDPQHNYQYSPFGVPGLGIVRGLADNLVVAPYATGLAAMVEPGEAAHNYRRLEQVGALGRYGFYEAVDHTRSRLQRGEDRAIIRSHMAHHQGMTVVAIHNVVLDGLMRDRFHTEPMVAAAELLLQERAPRFVPASHARSEEVEPMRAVRAVMPPAERFFVGRLGWTPAVHLMSNGRLSVTLTPAGGGQLRWRDLAITRWSPDPTTTDTGDFIYLRESRGGSVWSGAVLPVRREPQSYEVRFSDDRALYRRRDGSFETTVEHHVSPESDAVVRRVTVRNSSRHDRALTVSSYAELVLANARDDAAHPAFSKLFVWTEHLPEVAAILATRRRRSPDDPEVWAAHFVVVEPSAEGGAVGDPVPGTDRRAFLGRGRTTASPRQLDVREEATAALGHVLDPIFSLTQAIDVAAGGQLSLEYWTVVAASREEVLRLVDRHRAAGSHDRVTMLGWTQSQMQLRHLGITSDEAAQYQNLAGHVVYPQPAMRAAGEAIRGAGPQSELWRLGVSGDLPLLVVRIDAAADIDLARQVVRASEYWRTKRFAVDVVLVNEQSASYVQELQSALEVLAGSARLDTGGTEATGRIFVIRRDQVPARTMATLLAAARVVLVARRGDLALQMARRPPEPLPPFRAPAPALTLAENSGVRTGELLHFNGFGGFSFDGREYVTILDAGRPTPAPWTNVVANEHFGFHATAEGAGCTWWRNSRDNQLTPWRNDPVVAPVSEVLYVRDDTTGAVAAATASPVTGGRHVARHGFGYTRYTHTMGGVDLDQTVFVAPDDPVKLTVLTLTNWTGTRRTLTVTAYAELVLGLDRDQTGHHITTEVDEQTRALLARNPWSTAFADQVVFCDLAGRQESLTGDRTEFLGREGSAAAPRAVVGGGRLSGTVGAGLDPCAALQQTVVLGPGQRAQVLLLLGAGEDVDEVRALVARYRGRDPLEVLAEVRRAWDERLTVVQVDTPSPAFNVMMNGWLVYQTLACRMLARSGYYQASGAYGFRDQLQDSMAIVLVQPRIARDHLLRAAGRQFREGDVQHWWLPTGEGVRTRISDDVVWLAHAVCRYIEVTGDAGVLDEQVPFLEAPELVDDQHEAFLLPATSATTASLYEHCVLALERSFRYGRNGLPLMGTGDWNDGMNRVGAGGQGESVWLGWFLHATLTSFGALARTRSDGRVAERCAAERERLLAALEDRGWDGEWYRRGYFDDGTPLGSASRPECRIDAIAQSWAAISGAGDPARAALAMDQVQEQLVLAAPGISRLFTPPFDVSEPDPGYIRAYPPGVRENGGQYTHGALWSVFAWAALGREDRAGATFEMLNPVNHALTPAAARAYRVEPYVVAADVYAEEPYVGRGGWTWYTGSSGWMYRAGLEAILGLRRTGDCLVVEPCLPPDWSRVSVRYRMGGTTYDIDVTAPAGPARRVSRVVVDGADVDLTGGARVPLVDDGATHWVEIRLEPVVSTEGNGEASADTGP